LKLKCILINPWIYDFSAVNLWSRPLGLLKVAEYMSQFEVDIRLIDCMDLFKQKKYGTGKYYKVIVEKPYVLKSIPKYFKRYGMRINDFKDKLKVLLPCDFILITSIMSYWYPGVQKTIEVVKSLSPYTPVILGGIYATIYYEHARRNSGADFVYKGSMSERIKTNIEKYGIELQKTNRIRAHYKLNLYQSYSFAPILTSQGCPYRCSYCASSLLFSGFIQRRPIDVFSEIKELHSIGLEDFALYDDELLVNADLHIKIILKEVIKAGLRVRFHCPNGLHARFIDDEIAYLMKRSGFTTIRLSIETVNDRRQADTGGKVSTGDFSRAVSILKKHGFSKKEIGAYLMYGLPGQEMKEVREGVTFLKTLGIRINLTEFSPIRGTQCWMELIDRGIIPDNLDPLLTNNSVFSYLYSGYDLTEIDILKLDVKKYNSEI
jgi:radical SAM superfamily enzyme YgiQ (UPF0313 family)